MLSIIARMDANGQWVFTPDKVRELDRIAIEEQGIAGYTLMRRAGQFAFDTIRERKPAANHWVIYCGSGNNAGDGYVIGRLALESELHVVVVAVGEPDRLGGDAARACKDYIAAGGEVQSFSPAAPAVGDLVIDALLGTGLQRPLQGVYAEAVSAINSSGLPVVAVDIPTGLNGTDGQVMGDCVHAALTVTFVGLKQGLFLGSGPSVCGELCFSDLRIARIAPDRVAPVMRCVGDRERRRYLPARNRASHKGDFGHVLVVGGNHGMGGAVRLAGSAALRAGAGLVSVATRADNVSAVIAGRPELMCRGVSDADGLNDLLARASVVAIGPGLGQDSWASDLLARVMASDLPLVLDADALNLLAINPQRRDNWVLTPHPGEAGRLLGISTQAVQADRAGALLELQRRYGGVVLLKGAGTLVTGQPVPWVITAGNPGMSSAGMGDVLTGITAAVLAQCSGKDPATLVALGAWLHAIAGDRAARAGERGMLAGDVVKELRACLNAQ